MVEETPESHREPTESAQLGPPSEQRHLLVFCNGSSWMHQLPADGTVIIGRADDADLQIDDVAVSRHHAKILVHGGAITIADLGSHNGTFVNNERVVDARELSSGDAVSIHNTTLVVHCISPTSEPSIVLELAGFRRRLDDELERALRYERSFTVLVVLWPTPVRDAARIERVLKGHLRRIDAASWVTDTTLYVLLAEAAQHEAVAFVTRIRGQLDAEIRIGHASCPADGADLDQLLASAGNAAAAAALGETTHPITTHQTLAIGSQRLIIADPAVIRLYALIDRLARIDLPVLIVGETGAGKELAATAIHVRSPRRAQRLISLNCAALQETLVESELFGHERGAFSGAVVTKTGLIEAAHGSTLFLDEIGELSSTTQAKLLRVLESRRFTRVGDVNEREVDVRIVAATNRDLEADVDSGRFRQDLYFRLTGAVLQVPPLRQRARDLPLLAQAFLDDACTKAGRTPMRIGDAAMQALLAYGWPGNVRELKNLMQYVAAAYPEAQELRPDHVRDRLARGRTSAAATTDVDDKSKRSFRPLADEIRDLEITRIRAALDATGGNQTRAAALLSVPIRTFSEKVKLYGLPARKRGGPTES
jgi:two-component system, NtrC family, response regulator AtoC